MTATVRLIAREESVAPERVTLERVGLHSVDFDGTLDVIDEFIASGTPHLVATVNLDLAWAAFHDADYLRLLNDAALAVVDGVPLLWVSRLAGRPLPGRVNGTDLVYALAQRSAEVGYRLYFLGGAPGVAEKAARKLEEQFDGMVMAGTMSPPFGEWSEVDERRIISAVREAKPDVLFVGLGAPRQEKWMERHLARLGVPVCIGIGGSFDIIAGRVNRAPVWMQRHGLEWLHRLVSEPGRLWRRYVLHDGPLFVRLMVWAMATRLRRAQPR